MVYTPTVLILSISCCIIIFGLVMAALINVYFTKKNEEHVRHLSLIGKILGNAVNLMSEKIHLKDDKEEEKHEES